MAGGLATERADQYQGKLTSSVIIASIVASIGGFIFGYVGIFGQVTAQDIFYDLFYVDVAKQNPREYDYCEYSGRGFDFPLYASPLYLAGSLASILAYPIARRYGRRMSIIITAIILFVGGAVGVYPISLAIYLPSQILLGIGIGFGSQVILLYLSEIAPARFRGALSGTFQFAATLGLLLGNMIKNSLRYEDTFEEWLFYFSMGFPALPALFMIIGGVKFLPETPNSLVERGLGEKGREVLKKIRGMEDVDAEFQDIKEASEFANGRTGPYFCAVKNIFQRRNRPQLTMVILMPMFQNLTGIVFVFTYAPLLFLSMGYRRNANLYSAATNGSVLVVSSLVSMATVDRLGRKAQLISGGIIMIICQVVIAIMLGSNLFSDQLTTDGLSILVTVFIAIFVLAFGWSWGPLGWTIPSEILTLETRSVGQSIAVSINLLFAYIVLQFFIPLLCAFKYGLFLFFGGWIVVMTIFVCLFLPETKGVPIEEMAFLWAKHWFWKRFVTQDSQALQYVAQKSPIPEQV